MKSKLFSMFLTLLIFSTPFLSNTFAQDYTQLNLPEGAKARLGKGVLNDMQISPDNTKLAIASSIGVWLYDINTGDETALISGHTDVVRHVAFSPDGKILASSADDKAVRLWDVKTRKNLQTLNTPEDLVSSLKFLEDSKTLVGQNSKGTVNFWDITNGQQLNSFTPKLPKLSYRKYRTWRLARDAFASHVDSVTFSVGNKDGTISIQDGRAHRLIKTLVGRIQDIPPFPIQFGAPHSLDRTMLGGQPAMKWANALSFSPDGKILVSTVDYRATTRRGWQGAEGHIELWDVKTGKQLAALPWSDIKFSGDGKTLAIIQRTACAIWDMTTRRKIATFPDAKTVRFSGDGKTLVIIKDNGYVIWDIATRREIAKLNPVLEAFKPFPERFVLSQDGSILITADEHGTVGVWKTQTDKPLRTLTTDYTKPFTALVFSHDGKIVASGDRTGNIRLWNTNIGSTLLTLKSSEKSIGDLAFTADNKTLVNESDGNVYVWGIETGKQVNTHKVIPDAFLGWYGNSFDDGTSISLRNACVFTSNGEKLIIDTKDGITIWDVANTKHLNTLTSTKNYILAVSSDGKLLADTIGDAARLWDTHTGKQITTLKTSKNWIGRFLNWFKKDDIYALAFSHNKKILAVATKNKEIQLWDLTTHQRIRTLKAHKHIVCQLVFSQDGTVLASGDTGGKIHIWELPSGHSLAIYDGHKSFVRALAFAPDGKTLTSISGNEYRMNSGGTIFLWDVPSK
ncbi:MAG: WD40 repeat domain-containing protein [Candidatus Poribacteria bacterium]|nr:WD40 repeat domain-containing protein [Candidatus Poribacteria bacterium]